MTSAERLRELEGTISRYLPRDVAREAEAGIREAIKRFKPMGGRKQSEFEPEARNLSGVADLRGAIHLSHDR